MKVIAISQRGTKRDFVDLFFILQDLPFHKVAEHMVKRFGKERINPIHLGKSLVYFSDAESNPEPEHIKGKEYAGIISKFFSRIMSNNLSLILIWQLKNKNDFQGVEYRWRLKHSSVKCPILYSL